MSIVQYVRQSMYELTHHVTWPTWKDLQKYTVMILIASLIFGMLIYLMDVAWGFLLTPVYG